ncbi:MAG: hypothetical protein JNJ55_13770 [Betaproteobacteria bacterium]|nr:hypothetical protein [Betaproteobacteria bacterium]
MPTAISLINRLFVADQNERAQHPTFGTEDYLKLRDNDARRRAELRHILTTREVNDAMALYRAAMVFQHSDGVEDIDAAHHLALRSADAGYRPARWLAASARDRWLMYQGLPQRYGTQIVPDGKRQRVWHCDPATTDAERQAWDVSPLADLQREAERVTAAEPVPSLDEAPDWLKTGIEKWKALGEW